MKQFGLIGFPLSHSFSKKYFTEKFLKEGLGDFFYELFPIESIDELAALLQQNPQLCGINVTIPYKEKVLPFLYEVNDAVKNIGACNCIKIKNGKLYGFNTDAFGFETALKKKLQPHHTKALVLGTGGAAKAVCYTLQKLHINYLLVSRQAQTKTDHINYKDLNKVVVDEYTLIVNTSPVGTHPAVDECPDIPYEFITNKHYLFDLVYNPAKTLFLQKGEALGAAIENGYEMLELQAEESWRIWNDENL